MTIAHFADSIEELDRQTESIKTTARKHMVVISTMSFQQEAGLNTTLPLCTNKVAIKRTLTTETVGIFMPFSTQELNQKKGFFYGVNSVSRNVILFNRTLGKNQNGFVLGTPGSGKSFISKTEIMNAILATGDDVLILDPEREYYPLATVLNKYSTRGDIAKVVHISLGGKEHINPLDFPDTLDDDDPLSIQLDFVLSLIQQMYGRYELPNGADSIIDRCMRTIYRPYLDSVAYGKPNKNLLPTLADLQREIAAQGDPISHSIALSMEVYTTGSLNLFSYKTNLQDDPSTRMTIYDIKDVGASLKNLAMLIVTNQIWSKLTQNRARGKRTWIFFDEIYLLFNDKNSADFLKALFKRARKYGGIPTGLTQNVEDLLLNDSVRTMLSNSEYICMLNQAPLDRTNLAGLLNISETQMSYISNADPGCGLIYTGASIVPFQNRWPKDTKLYKAMTTNLSDLTEEDLKMLREES